MTSMWARAPGRALTLALLSVVAILPDGARAQSALERHPVPVTPPPPTRLTIDERMYGSDDATPFGVDLAGVTLIGETGAVAATPSPGIAVGEAPIPAGKGGLHADLAAALSPFLDRPLSPRAIAALQGAVAGVYRANGLPFVSVTAPPQEITAGILQLRVIVFRLGTIGIRGGSQSAVEDRTSDAIGAALRTRSGETIDARRLSEDLDWLNRVPYRQVTGVFSPGEATALSNLTLTVSETKPWSIQANWSNSGSAASGLQRYSIGGGFWLPAVNGATVSYLLTGGTDLYSRPGRIVPRAGRHARYLSHAARIVVPTLPRQELEFTPNLVASRDAPDEFTAVENLTFELPVLYRSAVSNVVPGLYLGEVYGGVSFKAMYRTLFFDGIEVASGHAALMQFTTGWAHSFGDDWGRTAVDLRLMVNPGATVAKSDDATWSSYTNGRVDDMSYIYGIVNLNRRTDLPSDWAWVSGLTGVFAGVPLPDTERLALGGPSGSRGYGFYDTVADRGVIWRNELRMPGYTAANGTPPLTMGLSPYLFADMAWGQDVATRETNRLASLGAGADLLLAGVLTGGVTAGRAMTDAGNVHAGHWTVRANLGLAF